MAIAGGAAPSYEARVMDGQLHLERQTLRQNVVSDIDMAIQELMQGKTIFLSARSDVVSGVRRTVEMASRRG